MTQIVQNVQNTVQNDDSHAIIPWHLPRIMPYGPQGDPTVS